MKYNASDYSYSNKNHNTTPFVLQLGQRTSLDQLKPYSNKFLEIRYVVSGEVDFICSSKTCHAVKGDVIVINPYEKFINKAHNIANVKYNTVIVDISEKFTGFLYKEYFEPLIDGREKIANVITDYVLQNLVIELFEKLDTNSDLYNIKSYGLFLQIITYLKSEYVKENTITNISKSKKKHKEIVDFVFDYILEHYSEQISLSSMAKSCFITEAHLCRIFKNEIGKSPINFLIDFRIDKAVSLLANFDLSIREVSEKCGFTDFAYFSRCFKKRMQMSPTEYVKKTLLTDSEIENTEEDNMKNKFKYIDIMEKVLNCYTTEKIQSYYEEVKQNGIREHGFPRLVSNMGILIAFGRCKKYKDLFCEMMTYCCELIPSSTMASRDAGNEFIVREICMCIDLIREKSVVEQSLIDKWISCMKSIDPKKIYTCVATSPEDELNNWAIFAGISELARNRVCSVSTDEFIDLQFASQIKYFDNNGMYMDPGSPMVYDYVSRLLFDFALHFGYAGKYRDIIKKNTDLAAQKSILFQSVTGEMPYGGRSMQCLHNEMWLAADYEYHASRLKEINPLMAGRFKMAADLAYKNILWALDFYNSHVKNCFSPQKNIGCENYAYFDKYMITAASAAYMAFLLADDAVEPSPLKEKYIVSPGKSFHKIFAKGFDWFIEIDTNADYHYDANGIGRIHKKGCPPTIAISVPFPGKDSLYFTEKTNQVPMSLCTFVDKENEIFYGSQQECRDITTMETKDCLSVLIKRRVCDIEYNETYTILKDSVILSQDMGANSGFMLPVIYFDGKNFSEIKTSEEKISVKYMGHTCTYYFKGNISGNTSFYNRNGEYKVFKVFTDKVKIVFK